MTTMALQKKSVSLFWLCSFLGALLMPATPVLGWGERGHQLVVRMASSRLTDATLAAITDLLGEETMESVAMWADRIKPERPETAPFHYINFPRPGDQETRTFVSTESNILTAIDHYARVLGDPSGPKTDRQEALKFLLHLVADLHQPLHCSTEGDVGGNTVAVWYFGKGTNLHKVWDFELINSAGLPFDAYCAGLNAECRDDPALIGTRSTPTDWAAESHAAGLAQAYLLPPDHQLAERYYETNIRTVNRQLFKAGNRLADLLNSLLDRPFAPAPQPLAQGTDRLPDLHREDWSASPRMM